LHQKFLNFCVVFKQVILVSLAIIFSLSCNNRSSEIKAIEKKFDFVVEKRFSSEDAESPYFFGSILNVCTNTQYIYVADWKNYCIKIFDKTFKIVKTIGKLGSGPIEFSQIFTDFTCDEKHIYLLTITRFYIFSEKGDFQKEILLKFQSRNLYPVKEGFLFKKNFSDTAFKLLDNEGHDLKTFFPNKVLNTKECGKIYVSPEAYLSSDGFFFVLDSTRYNIELLDISTGKTAGLISRDCDFWGMECRKTIDGGADFIGGYSQMMESRDSFYYIYYKSEKKMKIDIFKKPKSTMNKGLTLDFTGKYSGKFIPSCLDNRNNKFLGTFRDDSQSLVVCKLEVK